VIIFATRFATNTYPTPIFAEYIHRKTVSGLLIAKRGHKIKKYRFNPIFTPIFISLIIANFQALFCNLNFAKGIEIKASKATISPIHKMYSGLASYSIIPARGFRNVKSRMMKTVELTAKLVSIEE